jgi:hypothetical protein
MAKIAPYTNLDFTAVKADLLTHLRNQDQFKGFDFEGSNMNILVDLLAYNTYSNMQYYNLTLGETFLDSAQLKNSVVSHAKELNYLPRSRRSAAALVSLRITNNQESNAFNIPRGTSFLGRCGNISYTFITNKPHVATRLEANSNVFEVSDVAIYEGRVISEVLDIDNPLLSNSSIDTRSVRVFVNDVEYRYATGIFGVVENDRVFYLQPELNDKYSIEFGQTVFGYQPTATDRVEISYRVCSGEQANGVKSFSTNAGALGAGAIVVTPVGLSVGGADAESLESIKQFAPKAFQVQDRAVTASDYEVLLKTQFPEIENISVFGGDEANPPQYGRVIIAVDVQGRDGAASTELALYKDYIKTKSPLSIEPIFQEAKFMYAKTSINVLYDRNEMLTTSAGLESLVRDALTTYSQTYLNKFAANLGSSDLTYQLSLANDAIVSVAVSMKPMFDYKPQLNAIESPTFEFKQELLKPYPFNATNGLTDYKPCVTSTRFTIDNTVVELQDNGKGIVQAIISNDILRSVYKKDLGTVNYGTGEIILKDLIVASFEGTAIEISVEPKVKDFRSPKDRIFRIRQQDTTVITRPA